MNQRAEEMDQLRDALGPIVDGEPEAVERFADLLAEDDEARDLRHEATRVARELADAGADYVPPGDIEARLIAALDARPPSGEGQAEGRTTSPGFAAPAGIEREGSSDPRISGSRMTGPAPAEPATGPAHAETLPAPVRDVPVTRPPAAPTSDGAATPPAPGSTPSGAKESPKKGGTGGLLLLFPFAGAVALAAAALIAWALWPTGEAGDEDPSAPLRGIGGTVATIAAPEGSIAEVQRVAGAGFSPLAVGETLAPGAIVRTDARSRLRLSLEDGSEVVLNHGSELELVGGEARTFRLRSGELMADVARFDAGPNARFLTASGEVEVLGTKLVITAVDDLTSVRVTRGAVSLSGADGEASRVHAGEEGVVRLGGRPEVSPVVHLAQSLAFADLEGSTVDEDDDALAVPGLGSLRARRPGEQRDSERPLSMSRHEVRVRIVGNVARTEIEEVFRNDSEHTLEGIYRFPLPADAQIARLALDVDGEMEEGAFVERDRAAQIWRGVIRNATPERQRRNDEEFIWVPGPWRDPALLEWQRGGHFELRIFPIPARGERRVVLAYTQVVPAQGDRRRYVYPMPHAGDDSLRVGEMSIDVRVAGAERVNSSGYGVTSAQEQDATRLTLRQEDFRPNGDLVIDYALPGGERELSYWTYQGDAALAPPADSREGDAEVNRAQQALADDGRGYVAFALRPRLPAASERRDRDFAFVLDASQSMVGERFARVSELLGRVVREMDRRDRFTVFTCDYECRQLAGGLQTPTARAATDAREWLDEIEPMGASDVSASLAEVVAAVEGERNEGRELHVVYVGDGVSSAGYRRASWLAAEAESLVERTGVHLHTVGVGGDADAMVLGALARAGGGQYLPFVPAQRTREAALAILEATYGASLEAPEIELPVGLSEVSPDRLPTLRSGQEAVIVARMDNADVAGEVVLRGRVAGQPFEQRYPVRLEPVRADGNRFVPRLWAAGTIERLQLEGERSDESKVVALSKAYGVMSRHTSLLVLESEAMFRAFGVDRATSRPDWTGEEDVVGGSSEGVVQMQGQASSALAGLGSGGAGRGAFAGSGAEVSDPWAGAGLRGGAAAPARRARSRAEAAPRPGAAPAAPARDMIGESGSAPPGWDLDVPSPQQNALPARRRRPPGQWMRRVTYRVGSVRPGFEGTGAEREAARRAEQALDEAPNSRDRHRDAVRRLARAGELARALEVAEAWISRDRLDPEGLIAKAELLARTGERERGVRLLTGVTALAPEDAALQERVAETFERIGRAERACAHRIARAEIGEDASAIAAAIRCERERGRSAQATRWLESISEARTRTAADRAANDEASARRFAGDFTIEAEWEGGDDVDLGIIAPTGSRLSFMGGRRGLIGEDAAAAGRERLGLRWTAPGTYLVEVARTDPEDTRRIRGRLTIRILGQRQVVPFTLEGGREVVARVQVRRETRMEPVRGTP